MSGYPDLTGHRVHLADEVGIRRPDICIDCLFLQCLETDEDIYPMSHGDGGETTRAHYLADADQVMHESLNDARGLVVAASLLIRAARTLLIQKDSEVTELIDNLDIAQTQLNRAVNAWVRSLGTPREAHQKAWLLSCHRVFQTEAAQAFNAAVADHADIRHDITACPICRKAQEATQ
jgi:hypothetical protein